MCSHHSTLQKAESVSKVAGVNIYATGRDWSWISALIHTLRVCLLLFNNICLGICSQCMLTILHCTDISLILNNKLNPTSKHLEKEFSRLNDFSIPSAHTDFCSMSSHAKDYMSSILFLPLYVTWMLQFWF